MRAPVAAPAGLSKSLQKFVWPIAPPAHESFRTLSRDNYAKKFDAQWSPHCFLLPKRLSDCQNPELTLGPPLTNTRNETMANSAHIHKVTTNQSSIVYSAKGCVDGSGIGKRKKGSWWVKHETMH